MKLPFKEDGMWWIMIDGVKSSCGQGYLIDVVIWRIQIALRKIIAPAFCFIGGHSYEQQFYCYKCRVCGKRI